MIELLTTKLFIPRPQRNLVSRPHLVDRLNAGLDKKLTLIAAPAGFGKTTLLSEWIPQSLRSVSWFSLDETDNDLTQFWVYFIKSLQGLQADLGERALSLLQSPQIPPINSILTVLINDIASFPDAFSIVLEDYHVIESEAIHAALAFYIDHQPANMNLIITTRIDPPLPLAKMRVRDQLNEFRANDLRFSAEEASSFMSQVMGLSLSTEEVSALEARTEGWIAGLQIAALSMQGREDISGFIRDFSGSHRHILGYLAEEALSQCPKGTLNFLLQTSILDRLCGSLCEAVTEASGGQSVLESLERANLFITSLDDGNQWFRYHHLFADLLRHRLNQIYPDQIAKLHLNASQWYEQAGLNSLAIQHALSAQSFDRAAMLLEQLALAMIQRSELARLLDWLDALPKEVVESRPQLALYYCWGLFLNGQIRQAEVRLQAMESRIAKGEIQLTPEVQSHIAAIRSYLMLQTGNFSATIDLCRQALAHMPEEDALLRAMVALNLAMAYYLNGELTPASQLLTEIVVTGKSDLLMANTLSSIYVHTQLLRAQGKLQEALKLCRDGKELITRHGWDNLPAAGFIYVALGDLLREINELAVATEYLEKGIKLGQEGAHPHILIIGYVWLSLLRQTMQDEPGSSMAIHTAIEVLQKQQVSRFWPIPYAPSYQTRLWITRGNLAAAQDWVDAAGLNPADLPTSHLYEVDYIILARLLIAKGDLATADGLLHQLQQAAALEERNSNLIEILILQALLQDTLGKNLQAFPILERALELAEPEGYIRIFVDEGEPMRLLLLDYQSAIKKKDGNVAGSESPRILAYINKLLAAFQQPATIEKIKYEAFPEPISERELEILQLIAAGKTNQEIAEKLVIAVSTVKSHINNLYGKLGAIRRTEAVAIARELGLLSE